MAHPNFLYLHSHDTGRYIQPYGHAVATPALQRLAEQGLLFRQAFCAAPTCSASRAALLTGRWPHSAGMLGLAHRGFALRDYRQHVVHALRPHGYASVLCGVQHVARDASAIGYDRVLTPKTLRAGEVAQAAADWLLAGPPEPFFLSVGFVETHREFPPPALEDDPRYCRPPAPLPDTAATRRDMAAFRTSARLLDRGLGTVLAALDAAGLADRTLVVCTTDHGIAFPAMKCHLTDHGIGVLLVLRGPGGFAGGRATDALVSHIDLFPTLCDLAGIDPPPGIQGSSLLPLGRGDDDAGREAVFAEVTYHAAYEPMRAVRTRRWKYIRRFDGRTRPVLPNTDDGPSKDVWLAHGWRDRPVAEEQLYDLVFDPNEACNLAADPRSAGALRDLRERLARWMAETDDPLLRGPVPAPPGAVGNDPDGVSPKADPRPLA